MKKPLQLLLAFGMFLFVAGSAKAQISYTQAFDDDQHGWDLYEFNETTQLPCEGAGALNVNLYIDWDFGDGVYEAEADSPTLGTSNGGELTVSFDYKVLDYPLSTVEPTSSGEWGIIQLYYAYDAAGPWTLLHEFDSADHVTSTDCATISASFFPTAGEEVFIGIFAEHSFGFDDYYLFIDNFSAIQAAPITCSTAPLTSTITADEQSICNNETTTIAIDEVYTDLGITYQWQSSADNVTYTDINGETETSLEVSQTASTWYRALIICSNGNLSIPTSAIQILSTGDICYCPVTFPSANIEPISLVNFAGINNVTSAVKAGAPAYEDFTATITPPVLVLGEAYPIALEGNTVSTQTSQYINHFNVFIDWNHNGTLDDAGEMTYVGQIQGSNGADGMQATGSITVPPDATIGLTRMRVVKKYNTQGGACNATGFGQAEDYTVNIQATASSVDFSSVSLRYYPNPVKDVLNLSSVAGLQSVEVFNMLGQQVLAKEVSGNEASVNMAALTPGSYLVKVQAEGGSKNIKIVKQ